MSQAAPAVFVSHQMALRISRRIARVAISGTCPRFRRGCLTGYQVWFKLAPYDRPCLATEKLVEKIK